jgi:hypothetical protein
MRLCAALRYVATHLWTYHRLRAPTVDLPKFGHTLSGTRVLLNYEGGVSRHTRQRPDLYTYPISLNGDTEEEFVI